MPEAILNHETECKRISELRAANIDNGGEKSDQPQIKSPRKRFPWTETTR